MYNKKKSFVTLMDGKLTQEERQNKKKPKTKTANAIQNE